MAVSWLRPFQIQPIIKKIIFIVICIVILIGMVYFYVFDPEKNGFFLKCPFKMATGLDCPGCGSQRALHALLHGDFGKAFHYNPLLMLSMPYLFLGLVFQNWEVKIKYPKTRKFLFGAPAIYLVLALILIFFVLRNI